MGHPLDYAIDRRNKKVTYNSPCVSNLCMLFFDKIIFKKWQNRHSYQFLKKEKIFLKLVATPF